MSGAEAIRREYESSLSWRITRPLRRAKRLLLPRNAAGSGPDDRPERLDSWLDLLADDRLRAIDAACAAAVAAGEPAPPELYASFRALDVDTWALLLTQDYDVLPGIRGLLPDVPDPPLQEAWNGASGARLAAQSAAFYAKVRDRVAVHGDVRLTEARVLDHGCGWGRLTRFFARDVAPGSLFGVDPTPEILRLARAQGVPAELHDIGFHDDRLPVAGIDVAYSFSVFTHLSEAAADRALDALHATLRPGGILVATVRPPAYLGLSELMEPARRELGPQWRALLREPRHVFVPHAAVEIHPQYDGGAMTYGEAIITVPWVRRRWAPRFELLDVAPLAGDLHQVVLTLRRAA